MTKPPHIPEGLARVIDILNEGLKVRPKPQKEKSRFEGQDEKIKTGD